MTEEVAQLPITPIAVRRRTRGHVRHACIPRRMPPATSGNP